MLKKYQTQKTERYLIIIIWLLRQTELNTPWNIQILLPENRSMSGLEFYRGNHGNCHRGSRGEQNDVDHCCNDGNFLPYSAIFILYSLCITWIQMLIKSCVNHYFSLSFLRKKTLKKYIDMFLACQQSKVTIKLHFYYSNLKNAVETAKIAVDSCYVLQQFLTPLPSIDFREIRGPHVHHKLLKTPCIYCS
jgi:hypothetical protein